MAILNNDWADAVDPDGNPLVDVMSSPIKLTFDYDQLNGNEKADKEGRATATGTFYNLDVSGICESQNYTYATSGFLDITRLQEWKKIQEDQAAQKSKSSESDSTGNGNTNSNTNTTTNTTNTTNTNTNTADGTGTNGSTDTNAAGNNSTQSGTAAVQGGTTSSGNSKDTERAAVGSSSTGNSPPGEAIRIQHWQILMIWSGSKPKKSAMSSESRT